MRPAFNTYKRDIEVKPYLYKHVATIHKSNSLSLLQNKISNVLYFNAYNELKTKEFHVITIKELCEFLNYKGHNYEEIKQALRGLISTVIEWNMLHDEKIVDENWTASTALASASLKKGGICEYSYSYHMRQLLSDPVMYASINMSYQANFRSKYGLALYENCARFVNIKQTPWFELQFFRQLMGLEENKYSEFCDFKKRVLDVAVDEVNMYSDINISCTLKRLGRAVDKIKFTIETRERKPKIHIEAPVKNEIITPVGKWTSVQLEVADILKREFLFSEKQINKTLANYSIEYIQQKIQLVSKSAKSARSITAYMISALREDYTQQKPIDSIQKEILESAKGEHQIIQAEKFCAKIKLLSNGDSKAQDFLERFKGLLNANYPELYKEYCKSQFKSPAISKLAYNFYLEKFNHVLDNELED